MKLKPPFLWMAVKMAVVVGGVILLKDLPGIMALLVLLYIYVVYNNYKLL